MAKTVAKSSAPEAALSRAALEAVEDGDRARLDLAALISGAEASDFTFSILRPPVHGTASIKGQVLRFNPGSAFQSLSAGETHSEVIRVEAVSASGTRLVTSIQLSVTGRNDAPVLAQARVTLAEDDGRQMVDLADLTQDPDLDDAGQHSYEILRAPQAGTARINGSNLIFKPGAAFQQLGEGESQTVTVKVRVTDAHGDSTISKITLRVVGENDAPDMARGKMEADGDGPMVRLDLAAITEDVDGDALRFAIAGKPAEGVATLNGSILRFNPKADFLDLGSGQSRDVKIRIEVTDAQGAVDQAVVVVRVTGTNEAPTFSASALRTTEDGPVFRLDLSELSGDPDGGALVYAIHRAPSEGIASIRGSTLRFNPADDFQDLGEGETRDVKIRVTATDSDGASVTRTITVTVTGQDDQPVLQDGVLRATEDGPQVTLDLGSIIHDPDATSPVSFAVAGALPEGSAWINASNQLVFDPGDGFQDLAKGEKREIDVPVIAYLDGTVVSVSTVTVKVTGRNDAPTLKNGGLVLDETEQTLSLDLAAIASDVDRLDAQGGFSFELLTAPWNGISRIEDGVFYFDRADHYDYLPGGEREYHSLVFEITDVHGATGYGQYDLNVVGRDVAPRPVDGWDIHYVKDGSATEIDIAPAFFDPDSGPLSYSVVTRPEAGRITRDGSVLTFLPGSDFDDLADGETRSVFVDVRAKDGTGPSPTKRLELRMVGGETESIPGVGFALQGTHGGDTYNVAGDVNADGIVDFFAGFSQEKGVSGQIVEAFSEVLVSGRDLAAGHPFPASFAPDLEDGVTVLTGEGIETYPAATRALGDVNGDGVDDVLLWGDGIGAAYVLFGQGGVGLDSDLSNLNGATGFRLDHDRAGAISDITVADVTGDGINDILLSLTQGYQDPTQAATSVIFGRSSGFAPAVDASALPTSQGVEVLGAAPKTIGDFNGDGLDDFLIQTGADDVAHIVYGRTGGAWTSTSQGLIWNSEDSIGLTGLDGYTVADRPGDLNADGRDDLVLFETDGNQAFVIEGRPTSDHNTLDVNDYQDIGALRIIGQDSGINQHMSGTTLGDVNGDGVDDLGVVQQRQEKAYDDRGDFSGWKWFTYIYLLSGNDKGFGFAGDPTLGLDTRWYTYDYDYDFELYELRLDYQGSTSREDVWIDGGGDINGDSYGDVIIATSGSPESYVVYGGPALEAFDRAVGSNDNSMLLSELNDLSFG